MACELCTENHPQMIWGNENFYLIDASNDDFPCYLRLVSRRHVPDVTDLPELERVEMWLLLMRIENMIKNVMQPDKVNLAQFGNMVPHLHWHIIARWQDDTYFPECPWGKKLRNNLPALTEDRRQRFALLKATLAAMPSN